MNWNDGKGRERAMQKRGIDVSKYQGVIDWTKAKQDGVQFAILRAGWGQKTIDGSFRRNAEQCTAHKIPFGVYWFSYATTPEHARKEAQACLKAIEPYKLTYPVCYDFEYDSVVYAKKKGITATRKLVSDMARAFLNEVKAAGYIPCNYTNLDFSSRYFDRSVMEDYDKWAARYTSKPKDVVNGASLWQYSSTGKVLGISGKVDMDYALKDYEAAHTGTSSTLAVPVELEAAKTAYQIPVMYKSIFNPVYYLAKYPDLQEAVRFWVETKYIPDTREAREWVLFEHFYMFGMKEARIASEQFDVKKYREKNIDLDVIFGDEWPAYYAHYITCGKEEIEKGERADFN